MDYKSMSKKELQQIVAKANEELLLREKTVVAEQAFKASAAELIADAQSLATLSGQSYLAIIRAELPDELIDFIAFGGRMRAPAWTQPLDASSSYNTGDRVLHKGTFYVSLIDGNTFEPGTYPGGWKEEK